MELYHYTTIDTLEAIISNRTFRFTSLQDLNDTTEYLYGVELLKKKVLEYEVRNNISKRIDLSMFDRFMIGADLYSVSFTERKDDIVYWNSYYITPNTSIAIGVDSNKIFNKDIVVNKCIYGDPYPNMDEENYLFFKSLFDNPLYMHKNRKWIQITFQTAMIKKIGFEAEREWRGVTFPSDRVSTFERKGRKCKFCDCPININGIKRIIVGPSEHQNKNVSRANAIINEQNLDIKVELSNLPLVL